MTHYYKFRKKEKLEKYSANDLKNHLMAAVKK